eukprot:737956-Pyramimonas_sp.AAC.1
MQELTKDLNEARANNDFKYWKRFIELKETQVRRSAPAPPADTLRFVQICSDLWGWVPPCGREGTTGAVGRPIRGAARASTGVDRPIQSAASASAGVDRPIGGAAHEINGC